MSLKTKATLLRNETTEDSINTTGTTTGAAHSIGLLVEEFFRTIFTF
jgi:hypothetical protein